MIRMLGAGLLLAGLGGCATPADGAWWRDLADLPSPASADYRFDWRIGGDPALAPLQVFDDGRETWLQYPADQPLPALFERTARGDRLLRPRREQDYLVLRGVPQRIVLRGGLSQAEVWRATDVPPSPPGDGPVPSPVAHLPMPAPPLRPVPPPMPPVPPAPSPSVAAAHPAAGAAVNEPADPTARPPARPRAQTFEVTPADGNVRRALGRWAQSAGWTFGPEHWDVDVDIPLAGSAVFGDTFRTAVRGLLAATELGDRPVQPCFYANQVLRVVPLAQRCDRTRIPGAGS
jgi:hypothetical protein